jgi:hypothetical protein
MLKKYILGSLFTGSCVVLGHSYYYSNKSWKDCNSEENINKCNLLSDNMKKKLTDLLSKYK